MIHTIKGEIASWFPSKYKFKVIKEETPTAEFKWGRHKFPRPLETQWAVRVILDVEKDVPKRSMYTMRMYLLTPEGKNHGEHWKGEFDIRIPQADAATLILDHLLHRFQVGNFDLLDINGVKVRL